MWETARSGLYAFIKAMVSRLATNVTTRVPQPTGFKTASGVLLVLGITYGLNKAINSYALGHRRATDVWDWTREIVVVTGGSSGIGELIVRRLAQRGIKVVIIDINPPQDALLPGVRFYEADVSSPDAVGRAAERIRQDVGEPTVLINNAGIAMAVSILESTRDQIQRTFDVNTVSHFWLVKEFLPAMIKHNHGHVITMASVASFIVIADIVCYSCAKASAMAFHEGLGQELKHIYEARNIRTSIVHPYWVRTPMTAELVAGPGFKDAVLDPEQVAAAVVKQVLGGRSGQVVMPARCMIVAYSRAFPAWLQEWMRDSKAGIYRK
ncbi:hypothetical protein G6O67_007083 [Ophiocordyceps sinensis]|uniref:Short-chain dehydrogenase/reductase 3 n=2 Tax=Ophiocordyceps sinensis TaxID=72228 RepID=A0A8H4LTK0_9HYPO|nr:short chain dehydrogenase/reductase [Ophiocordyceps sinensis CO18]KAF4505100.1 hypothetical protein G6O67_007083 [Ophiocordyceps sinensis]